MPVFREFWSQVKAIWGGLQPGQRVLLVVGAAGTVALMAAVFVWASQLHFGVLYGELELEDAAAVAGALDDAGIPYRTAAGGRTVLVPATRVNEARLVLARNELPARGGKKESGADRLFGGSPFGEQIQYTQKLQQDLETTIMQLQGVRGARVHIARPRTSLFPGEQQESSAAVVVELRRGAVLTPEQVAGIASVVAGSVPNLQPKKVTVLDGNGRVLSGGELGSKIPRGRMEYRKRIEQYLAGNAQAMLDHVLGQGRALVRVSAVLDFQSVEESTETYDPEGKVIASERITSSKSGSGGGPRGPAGTASNVAGAGAGAGAGGRSEEETIESEFLVSKTVKQTTTQAGEIKSLSVACVVDLSAPAPKEGEDAKAAEAAKPKITLKDCEEIVKTAVGYTEGRDTVKVTEGRASPATTPVAASLAAAGPGLWSRAPQLARNLSLGLLALAALLLARRVLRRSPAPEASPEAVAALPAGAGDEPALRRRVAALVEADPRSAARLLEEWLGEDDSPA
jgi:flagellar M-ring protein FliF